MSFNPLKRRKYGSTKAVISELFKQVGGITKAMKLLEVGRTRTYDFTDPNKEAELSFERISLLTRETKASAAAEHLAHLAGGVFLPIDTLDEDVDWHNIARRASMKNAANIGGILNSLGPDSETPGDFFK